MPKVYPVSRLAAPPSPEFPPPLPLHEPRYLTINCCLSLRAGSSRQRRRRRRGCYEAYTVAAKSFPTAWQAAPRININLNCVLLFWRRRRRLIKYSQSQIQSLQPELPEFCPSWVEVLGMSCCCLWMPGWFFNDLLRLRLAIIKCN